MIFIKYEFIALLIIYSGLTHAQNITDTTKTITLKEVVISVNKTEETKKTVAQQVEVLTSRDIQNSQSQTTADLIANTGNVFVQKSQLGGGSPVIWGLKRAEFYWWWMVCV